MHTCQELYQPEYESAICSALSSGSDLSLDPRSEDHHRLIADISFQLTEKDLQQLTSYLKIKQPELDSIVIRCGRDLPEQIYQVLLSWMSRNYPNSTVKTLLSTLQTLGFSSEIELCSWKSRDESVYRMMFSQFSESCIRWDEKLMQALALEVWQRSKFIGRYIGVSEADINAAIHDNLTMAGTQSEHSYQILRKWQQQRGTEATYRTLLKAICRVFEHDPTSVCSAWWFARKHFEMDMLLWNTRKSKS